jgi:DNA-binding transcriptional ArsR family regulator
MELLAVLADPVRRDILVRLKRGPLAAGEIAAGFPISRPAVSRHLRVLREAGLVSVTLDGRTRRYRFEPAPLAEIDRWLAPLRDVWTPRLDALETEVYRTRRERRTGTAGETPGTEKTA